MRLSRNILQKIQALPYPELSSNITTLQENMNAPLDFCGISLLAFLLSESKVSDLIIDLKQAGARLSAEEIVDQYQHIMIRPSSQDSRNAVAYILLQRKAITLGRVTFKALFEAAKEQGAGKIIDQFIESKWIPAPQYLKDSRPSFWVRIVPDLKQEMVDLTKRQSLSATTLKGHLTPHPARDQQTNYSPATFIRNERRIHLYGLYKNKAGVILILPPNKKIDYWYSGLRGEELTRDLDYSQPLQKFLNEEDIHHMANISAEALPQHFDHCVRHLYQTRYRATPLDHHGVIERHRQYSWNEGLFRYQAKDIKGIFVNPTNIQSICKAFELKKLLFQSNLIAQKTELPFFYYDAPKGKLSKVPENKLRTKLEEYYQKNAGETRSPSPQVSQSFLSAVRPRRQSTTSKSEQSPAPMDTHNHY